MSSLTREEQSLVDALTDHAKVAQQPALRNALRQARDLIKQLALRALPAGEVVAAMKLCGECDQSSDCLHFGQCFRVLAKSAGTAPAPVAAEVEVRVGCMTESNGRETWIVQLYQPADSPIDALQVYASNVKGRAEYEAARFRHFFGQGPEPDLLAYDTDESPVDSQPSEGVARATRNCLQDLSSAIAALGRYGFDKDATKDATAFTLWANLNTAQAQAKQTLADTTPAPVAAEEGPMNLLRKCVTGLEAEADGGWSPAAKSHLSKARVALNMLPAPANESPVNSHSSGGK